MITHGTNLMFGKSVTHQNMINLLLLLICIDMSFLIYSLRLIFDRYCVCWVYLSGFFFWLGSYAKFDQLVSVLLFISVGFIPLSNEGLGWGFSICLSVCMYGHYTLGVTL